MKEDFNNLFKPIAFTLSKKKINLENCFFSKNISNKTFEINNWSLNIWYLGTLDNLKTNEFNFCFSFPKSKNLLDRNLIISKIKNKIVIENDWLGSIPVFYNEKDYIISTIPNICLNDKLLDEESFINFCEFGYSVFERTPFKNVKFLRHYSSIVIEGDRMRIKYKDDPVMNPNLFVKTSNSDEVIESIKKYIKNVENKISGNIIIPTSGGYDSRLLNLMVEDKSRILSYTYGLSKKQNQSYEVVFARKISEILNIKWEQIHLSNYNDYINDWHKLYGFSSHLHGMYHIEFFKKIISSKPFTNNSTLLSGIIGDAWSGKVKNVEIKNEKDIIKLGYSHGLFLDKSFFKIKCSGELRKKFYLQNKKYVNNSSIQIIMMMRMKIIMLSYLTSLPEYFGIPTWTPFLNFNIVNQILTLKKESKKNRNWQKELFVSEKLDIENMNLKYNTTNSLNHIAAGNYHFEPIETNIFNKLLNTKFIKKLNQKINKHNIFLEFILTKIKLRSFFKKIGIHKIGYLGVLSNYHILKAIDKSIKK